LDTHYIIIIYNFRLKKLLKGAVAPPFKSGGMLGITPLPPPVNKLVEFSIQN
jgi:hypothetical protein